MSGAVRVQRRRTPGSKMPPNTIYVGRPGRHGNPFVVGGFYKVGTGGPHEFMWMRSGEDRNIALRKGFTEIRSPAHAVDWYKRLKAAYPHSNQVIADLRGRNLACWCKLCAAHVSGKPFDIECADCAPCHADPLGLGVNTLANSAPGRER